MNRRSAKALIINPNLMKPPVTPVGIDFLATSLRSRGYRVKFLDLAFEDPIEAALEREAADNLLFVGLSARNIDDSFFASSDFCLSKLRPIVRKIKELTDAPIVLGGVGYSIFPVAALDYCEVDFGIRGDGELAIVRLAEAFSAGETPHRIPGLVWKARDKYKINRPVEIDISSVDLSDRSTVDNLRYYNEGGMVGFETKRGCSASCTYCADPVARGGRSRQRPPRQVAEEIMMLADMGIEHFQTCDCEFNIPRSHAVEICREFIRSGLPERIRWYAYMTPAFFDNELASLMKRAGCAGINFGADHCDPRLLKTLGRIHSAEQLTVIARLCRKHGIECMFDLLLGAPGETPATLRQVVEFMKRVNPSCVGPCMGVRIYPGTPLARALSRELRSNAPGIHGLDPDNPHLLMPVYYLSPALGENPHQMLLELINGDARFFTPSADHGGRDFNYNNNSVLSEAIRSGERGTFWDILRRLKEVPSGLTKP